MDVSGDEQEISTQTANSSAASRTLTKKDLVSLADDPDDLKRELPNSWPQPQARTRQGTIITVDGFQNETQLPPKSSIAYIKVNPDLYSAEYREPSVRRRACRGIYQAGAVVHIHGALFTTNGSSWMNARNPFSTSKGSLGKQRYGFELSGPVRKQGKRLRRYTGAPLHRQYRPW